MYYLSTAIKHTSLLAAGVAFFALGTANANAASSTISTTTVNADNVLSGPAFTVNGDFLGTDTISLDVSGTVNLADSTSGGFIVNAAGVLTQSAPLYNLNTGDTKLFDNTGGNKLYNNTASTLFGSLLLGNSSLGFRQLFPANATNGFGSSNPSTNLSLVNVPLAALFGTGISNGTVLEFRTSDVNINDNVGAFTVSGSINSTAVPEPSEVLSTLAFGAIGAGCLLKRQSKKPTI